MLVRLDYYRPNLFLNSVLQTVGVNSTSSEDLLGMLTVFLADTRTIEDYEINLDDFIKEHLAIEILSEIKARYGEAVSYEIFDKITEAIVICASLVFETIQKYQLPRVISYVRDQNNGNLLFNISKGAH